MTGSLALSSGAKSFLNKSFSNKSFSLHTLVAAALALGAGFAGPTNYAGLADFVVILLGGDSSRLPCDRSARSRWFRGRPAAGSARGRGSPRR